MRHKNDGILAVFLVGDKINFLKEGTICGGAGIWRIWQILDHAFALSSLKSRPFTDSAAVKWLFRQYANKGSTSIRLSVEEYLPLITDIVGRIEKCRET